MAIKSFLPGRLGFGTAPLGNMFRAIPDEEAAATVDAAWDNGIRYFDTAPFYGAGLSEIRLGEALAGRPRDEFVLSTKVGRVILDEIEDPLPATWGEGRTVRTRTPQQDRQRLLGRRHAALHRGQPQAAEHRPPRHRVGARRRAGLLRRRVARRVRDRPYRRIPGPAEAARRGVIKAWGLGVNRVEPLELTLDLDEPKPDAFLLAGRYTLLDHERALQRLLPAAEAQDVDIVVGGPYSSGVLAGGQHFEYQKAPAPVITKVEHIKALAGQYGVGIKAAALQFSLLTPRSPRPSPVPPGRAAS